ncbi:MAG: hypothetical protein NT169_27965 [Chloroflexi bacterium]|nr:hypothetical protein [Chloroflexota bacterium]
MKQTSGLKTPGSYNTATIRDLLSASFSDEEFIAFCYDHFREVNDGFASGMPFRQKMQVLIEHCANRNRLDDLLELMRAINPNQYARFEPDLYVPAVSPSAALRRLPWLRPRYAVLLAGLLAAALGAGIWAWTRPTRSDWTPPPVCQPVEVVHVGLAPLSGCAPAVGKQLADTWQAGTGRVQVVAVDQAGRPVPSTDTPSSLDLVVTGGCPEGDTNRVALTYALVAKRTPDELYTPPRIVFTDTLEPAARLGQALISYQRGDPEAAVNYFSALPLAPEAREPALLAANSLLLAGRYDEAVAAFEKMTLSPATATWDAAYYNLGLTRLNRYLLKPEGAPQAGLDTFERAAGLARQGADPQIELMANVGKALLNDIAGNWSEADASCRAALSLNARSVWPYVCRLRHTFQYHARVSTAGPLPAGDIEQWLNEAERLDPDFVWTHYFRGIWHLRRDERQAAAAAFEKFYQGMHDRACLRTDQEALSNAGQFITGPTR